MRRNLHSNARNLVGDPGIETGIGYTSGVKVRCRAMRLGPIAALVNVLPETHLSFASFPRRREGAKARRRNTLGACWIAGDLDGERAVSFGLDHHWIA